MIHNSEIGQLPSLPTWLSYNIACRDTWIFLDQLYSRFRLVDEHRRNVESLGQPYSAKTEQKLRSKIKREISPFARMGWHYIHHILDIMIEAKPDKCRDAVVLRMWVVHEHENLMSYEAVKQYLEEFNNNIENLGIPSLQKTHAPEDRGKPILAACLRMMTSNSIKWSDAGKDIRLLEFDAEQESKVQQARTEWEMIQRFLMVEGKDWGLITIEIVGYYIGRCKMYSKKISDARAMLELDELPAPSLEDTCTE